MGNNRLTEEAALPGLLVAKYVTEITATLDSQHPLLSNAALEIFRAGGLESASFNITDPGLFAKMEVVFHRAADPEDLIASSHALRHDEAHLALASLAKAAVKGTLSWKKVVFQKEKHPEARYEFTANGRFNTTLPEAVLFAGEMGNSPKAKQISAIRSSAYELGFDVALLTCAYLDLPFDDVFKTQGGVFDAKVVPSKDYDGIPRPSSSRRKDIYLYTDLQKIITDNNPHKQFPNTNRTAFDGAKKVLIHWGANKHNIQMVPVRIGGVAVAVMPSLMTIAFGAADPRFRDPLLTQKVQEIAEGRVGTQILTAYVRWNFGDVNYQPDTKKQKITDN